MPNDLSRRNFIKTTGTIAGAAALAGAGTRSFAANEKINLGIIGTGLQAQIAHIGQGLNVHKDKIADGDIEFNKLKSDFHCTGIFGFGPVSLTSWTASYCESGVLGAATLGTKEKGRRGVEEAPSQLARWLNEFKTRPSPPRGDHHAVTPTMPMPWGQPERPTGAGDVHG